MKTLKPEMAEKFMPMKPLLGVKKAGRVVKKEASTGVDMNKSRMDGTSTSGIPLIRQQNGSGGFLADPYGQRICEGALQKHKARTIQTTCTCYILRQLI